jgi:hypothetical protein
VIASSNYPDEHQFQLARAYADSIRAQCREARIVSDDKLGTQWTHQQNDSVFPDSGSLFLRQSGTVAAAVADTEAYRATAQLLPRNHVCICEGSKDMKTGRPSFLLPCSRNPPPFRWQVTLARASLPLSQGAAPLGEIAGRIVLFVPASRLL